MTALITVDLQYDFFDLAGHPNAGRLQKAMCLPEVRRLVAHARTCGWKIIHVATKHDGTHTLPPHLARRSEPAYCIDGSGGAGLIDGLATNDDTIVEKQMYDAFSNERLPEELHGHDHVILCGIAINCCVLFTANSAVNTHGKTIYVPYQCVGASKYEDYLFGLRNIAKSLGFVVDLSNLISEENLQKLKNLRENDESFDAQINDWFFSRSAKLDKLQYIEKPKTVYDLVQRLEDTLRDD